MADRVAVVVIGVALAVAGCAGTAPADDGPAEALRRSPGPPTVHAHWASCSAAVPTEEDFDGRPEGLVLPRLDEAFQPVAAVVCRGGPQRRPSGGSDAVAVEDRADDVTALVAALRLPDGGPRVDACTMGMPNVPWLALLDAQGRWVRPGVPWNSCGKPRLEFRTAYDQLSTRRITTRVLHEIESDEAAASGCGQQWSDMVWAAGQSDAGRDTTPGALAADDAEVRVCVYRVAASEQGSDKPAGEFESGGTLAAGRWAAVRRELTNAGPASACSTPSSRFAVLHPPTGQIYLEADGCRRVLIDSGTSSGALRQGTAKLTSLLWAPLVGEVTGE